MSLNQEQLESIKRWVANGSSISDVQSKLKDEYGVVMTYIDVRFLIDDLGAELVSAPSNETTTAELSDATESVVDDSADNSPEAVPVSGEDVPVETMGESVASDSNSETSGVKVSVSPIQRPDCIISGDVEFSDGSKAEWRIDRMGQLGIIPTDSSMNPPQSDIIEFQKQLQQLLR